MYSTLEKALISLKKLHPDIWKYLNTYRQILISKEDTKLYPESYFDDKRCFLPDLAYRRLAKEIFPPLTPVYEQTRKMAMIAALAAWRPSQDIINIDTDVSMALLDTPCDKVPAEILGRLFAWSIYIDISKNNLTLDDIPIIGFFVYYGDPIGWSTSSQITELNILPWTISGPLYESIIININAATVEEALLEPMRRRLSSQQFNEYINQSKFSTVKSKMITLASRLVSVLLYVITEYEERLKNNPKKDRLDIPSSKKMKKGWQLFPPDNPRIWNFGQEIGEKIREGKKQERQYLGTRKGPRPHIRRAHWQTYKIGRRVWKEGETPIPQTIIVKWIPPIPVAMAEDASLEASNTMLE